MVVLMVVLVFWLGLTSEFGVSVGVQGRVRVEAERHRAKLRVTGPNKGLGFALWQGLGLG